MHVTEHGKKNVDLVGELDVGDKDAIVFEVCGCVRKGVVRRNEQREGWRDSEREQW